MKKVKLRPSHSFETTNLYRYTRAKEIRNLLRIQTYLQPRGSFYRKRRIFVAFYLYENQFLLWLLATHGHSTEVKKKKMNYRLAIEHRKEN